MAEQTWEDMLDEVQKCTSCTLHASVHLKVPGQGDRNAPLMLIGEGPGQVEDEQGLAFVGPAGQLLTKELMAIDLPRDRVYICNIVKCRPPFNRVPEEAEADACERHLKAQLALVKPKVIVLLGGTAAKRILGLRFRITFDHGRWFQKDGVWLMATYHPSALLRDETKKRAAWEDMQTLRDRLIDLGLYEDIYSREKAE